MTEYQILLAKFESTRDKVLVFSWSTTMLDVLEVRMSVRAVSPTAKRMSPLPADAYRFSPLCAD